MTDIIIDPELRDLCRPLTEDEREQLKASIFREGCREPLIVWRTSDGDVLVDGHNRHHLCTKLQKPFEVRAREFATRDDAKIWIINNQLGRRNLHEIDRVALTDAKHALQAAKAASKSASNLKSGANSPTGQIYPVGKTAENPDWEASRVRTQMAAEVGVSGKTYDAMRRVNTQGTPELVDAVRTNKIGASTAAEIATLPKQEQAEILAKGRNEVIHAATKMREARKPKPAPEQNSDGVSQVLKYVSTIEKRWPQGVPLRFLAAALRQATARVEALVPEAVEAEQ